MEKNQDSLIKSVGRILIIINLTVFFSLPALAQEKPIYSEQTIIYPDHPTTPRYPDLPLSKAPSGTLEVGFVFKHRTALNEMTVTVRGMISSTLLGEKACPAHMGMCAQPRITLMETSGSAHYNIVVLLPEDNHHPYKIGEILEITGIIMAGSETVMMRLLPD